MFITFSVFNDLNSFIFIQFYFGQKPRVILHSLTSYIHFSRIEVSFTFADTIGALIRVKALRQGRVFLIDETRHYNF